MGGHDAETVGHDEPKSGAGHDDRNDRSRCRNGRSRWAEIRNFDVLILDDLAYVTKDQAETSALFELISTRYERRSMIITANQPFGEWGKVFQDPAMTLAAIDRLVHHSTIFEMNVESYRRRTAIERKQTGPGRPASFATPRNVGAPKPSDNQTPT
jgi:hypothetical protein